MASNYTTNYGLCQWEPEDDFLRTEFNADNAKLDAALAGHDGALEAAGQRIDEVVRAVSNLSYNVQDLAMKDYYESKVYGHRQAMFLEDFSTDGHVASLGAGMSVQAGALVLGWDKPPTTMTTVPIPLTGVSWSRVLAWVKCVPGVTYAMTACGVPMAHTGVWDAVTTTGTECQELAFAADAPGSGSAVLTLTLTPQDEIPPRVYEYGVIFL